jgi:hypothetical protein
VALGIGQCIIGTRLLELTNRAMAAKLYTSEVYMRKRYLMDKKTPEEIAKECGVSLETIYVYLAKFGLRKSRR